jgi:mono/diheme cytochrome c family protein
MSRHLFRIAACAVALLTWAEGVRGDDVALARRAKLVFQTHCYRCHGQGGRSEADFNVAIDLKKLVEKKQVTPKALDDSEVYQRMVSKTMPPKFDVAENPADRKPLPRPTKDDIDAVAAWINAGAPDVPPTAAATVPTFISDADMIKFMHKDLNGINERDRPFIRYFTITHLYNDGLNVEELLTYQNGLSKLVNSLSWGRRVKIPKAIDPAKTIFRVDLRDYKWDDSIWNTILAQYPYGVTYADEFARWIQRATGCAIPNIRADWFVLAGSKPPLYHDVLQLPKTDRELEAKLDVNVAVDIQQERVARAAFNGSAVSRNNRLIERHESSFGAYWKSYDFGGNVGRQKLLTNPLGPGNGPREFQHDGGEIIFNLPNGLQAYLLIKADGTRIDKGPTNIVLDKEQPDGAVVNGISCMNCHKHGMIQKTDQVRDLANISGVFPDGIRETVLALYPPKIKFDSLLKEDAERFQKALDETGTPLSETEPIFALAQQFDKKLELTRAAAEAGQKPDAFRKLISQSPRLVESLASLLAPRGTVNRDTYVAAFPDIVASLHVGTFRAPKSFHPTVAGNSAKPAEPDQVEAAADAEPVEYEGVEYVVKSSKLAGGKCEVLVTATSSGNVKDIFFAHSRGITEDGQTIELGNAMRARIPLPKGQKIPLRLTFGPIPKDVKAFKMIELYKGGNGFGPPPERNPLVLLNVKLGASSTSKAGEPAKPAPPDQLEAAADAEPIEYEGVEYVVKSSKLVGSRCEVLVTATSSGKVKDIFFEHAKGLTEDGQTIELGNAMRSRLSLPKGQKIPLRFTLGPIPKDVKAFKMIEIYKGGNGFGPPPERNPLILLNVKISH